MKSRAFLAASLCSVLGAVSSYGVAGATPWAHRSIFTGQVATYPLSPSRTTSRHWRDVETSGFDIRSTGSYSVRVRTHLAGGRVLLRVVDGATVIQPGARAFSPTGHEHTFFFDGGGPKRRCGHLLRIQWRAATGKPVRLKAGLLTVHYTHARHDNGVCH